jgi:hypothetical protein
MNRRGPIKQAAILWFMCAATAFAGSDQPSASGTHKKSSKWVMVRRSCYVLLSGSPFPQPCERLNGAEPSTAIPMAIVGEPPKRIVRTQIVARGEN